MPDTNKKYSIAVFLPSLEKGGAERRMVLCAIALKHRNYQVEVLVLRERGAFVKVLKNAGIMIRSVDKKGRFDMVGPAMRARRIFKEQDYSAVLSCLPSANVFSCLLKTVNSQTPLVWGLAAADMPMHDYGLWARFGAIAQKRLSHFADKVIVNSYKGLQVALGQSYEKQKMIVIHNGVDTAQFVLDKELGRKWCDHLNIPDESKVIGVVARLDPAKGLETFLEAAELAQEKNWYFIIFASGSSAYAEKLKAKIESHSLFGKRLFLLENIKVDSSVYNAFDVTTISSVSESFPNVMLESMACGVPVIATNVGDCKKVLQQFGKTIPVNDSEAMFNAWQSQLKHELNSIGVEVMREYIRSEYSIQRMVSRFDSEVKTILKDHSRKLNK